MKFKKLMITASGVAMTGLALGMPANAQEADEAVEVTTSEVEDSRTLNRVTVTGSRITREDFTSPSPLVTTDIDDYVVSGRSTVDDFLRDLPQFAPGSGDFSNDSNGGTAGRATLNLRNLGAKRNLVIMDGRRLISSGTDGAIDINTIPSLAIGDIEVITGGASATYGSDALSGVVNFKTRTDLDGFEVDAQFSTLDDVGEDSYKIGAAYGTEYADGRGNLLITGEYTDRGGVRLLERDFFLGNPQNSTFTVFGGFRGRGGIFTLDDAGNFFNATDVSSTAQPGFIDSLQEPLIVNGADDLRTLGQFFNYLQVPLEQTNVYAKTDYQFANGVTAYGHILFSDSTAFNEGAAPVSAGIWGVTIPADNFYLNSNAALAAASGGRDVTNYQTRFAQIGPRVYNTENTVYQILGGLNGQIGDLDLNWDIHFSYGETQTNDRTISGAVNFSAVQQIIDSTDPATGESPLCAGGFNPFGGQDPLSAECLSFVSRAPLNETTLEQHVLEGVLEGKLFEMPAGDARFAVTAAYRENTYDFKPDRDIAAGELANLASSAPTFGSVEAQEIGAEVLLPVATDVNLTLGARLSDYNPAGQTETYKAEFDARLHENIMVRGGFQHAVRAPNVEEFFRASLLRVQPFLDPCSSRYRGVSVDRTAELALCALQGADPGYTQGGSSAPTFTNGNPNLVPEEADTLTFGGVLDFNLGPANVQLTADYYNIEVDKAIETLSAQLIFTKCFNLDGTSNPTYDPNYAPCLNINRPTGFDLDPVNQPILNLGGIKTAGIDIAGNVEIPVDAIAWGGGDGAITIRSLVNILDKHEIQAFSDESFTDFAGVVSAVEAYPDLKMFNSLSVESGPITVTGIWRHISEMDDISAAGGVNSTIAGADAYDYFDLTGRFTVNDQFEFYGGVNNLSDEEPPQIGGEATGSTFSATNQGVYDAIGRMFYIGARARF